MHKRALTVVFMVGGMLAMMTGVASANTGAVSASENCTMWTASASLSNNVTADRFIDVSTTIPGTTGLVNQHFNTTGANGPTVIWSATGASPAIGTVTLTIRLANNSTVEHAYTTNLVLAVDCPVVTTTTTTTTAPTTTTTLPETTTTLPETTTTAATTTTVTDTTTTTTPPVATTTLFCPTCNTSTTGSTTTVPPTTPTTPPGPPNNGNCPPGATSPCLPHTGSDSMPLGAAGFGLVFAGSIFGLVKGRRRYGAI